jgi:hypothetical protein
MPGEGALAVSPPPAFLRWVIPAAIVAALMVLGLLLKVQHNRLQLDEAGPVVSGETADVPELLAWLDHAAPILLELQAAFDHVGDAAQAGDFVAMSTGCRAGLDLASALIAELPSPDARLDDPFRRAFNDYDQALRHCVRGGENSDPAELAIAGDLIAVGDQHWRDAAGMIDYPWLRLSPSGSRPSHIFKT